MLATGLAAAPATLALAQTAAAGPTITTTTVAATTAPTTSTAPATTTVAAPTTTAAAAPPCSGAGLLAIRAPAADVPVANGPSVAVAKRTGLETASYADPAGAASASRVSVGAAGCLDAAGTPGGTAVATGAWSILGGAVSGTSLAADLVPSDTIGGAGWTLRTTAAGLRVDGRPAALENGEALPVGDWGTLTAQARLDAGAGPPLRWWAAALELRLTADHGGLPAGTTLLIGYAAADRPAAAPPKPPATTTTAPTTTSAAPTTTAPAAAAARAPRAAPTTSRPSTVRAEHRIVMKKRKKKAKRKQGLPLRATPGLGGTTYDFPVFGQVDWGDSYGSARSDVSGGWHHGDDLFAALGRPVVAVADGTLFAVGWNGVGGWRLWLRDERGNEFYYAHLSGYTALARNGAQVKRGQVIAFVGNTGDAFTTPDHLHFEIHPVGLLYLGYDGAVDPSRYLDGWRHPAHLKTLPPVALPDRVRHGDGSLVDFRQLLALHRVPGHVAVHPALHRKPVEPLRHRPLVGPIAVGAAAPVTAGGGSHAVAAALLSVASAVLALGGVFAFLRRRRVTRFVTLPPEVDS